MEIWGLPVVVDENMPKCKALVTDLDAIHQQLLKDRLDIADLDKMTITEAARYLRYSSQVGQFSEDEIIARG